MLSSLKKICHFLFQSNLFIAFAATCFTLQTQVQIGLSLQWHPYLLLVFLASFLGYNFYRLFILFAYPSILFKHHQNQELKKYSKWFYRVICIVIFTFIITCFFAKKTVLLLLLPLGIITVLYTFPLLKIKGNRIRIRELSFAKIFIIAFVWTISTILPPIIQSAQAFFTAMVFQLMLERFIFIVAITIPFDIRDIHNDHQIGLKTIPIMIGEHKAWMLSSLLLVLFILLSFIDNFFNQSLYIFYGLFLSIIITLICINHKKLKQWPSYYHILDGMIIVQALCVILSKYIIAY